MASRPAPDDPTGNAAGNTHKVEPMLVYCCPSVATERLQQAQKRENVMMVHRLHA